MGAPVLVQSFVFTGSLSAAFPSPNTAGNAIVAWYEVNFAASDPVFSDSNGNTYTAYAVQNLGTGLRTGFFIATGIAAGSNTLSITTIGASGAVLVCEYSGVTGIEASVAFNQSFGHSTLATGTITTTSANTLILMGGAGAGVLSNLNGWSALLSTTAGLETHLYSFAAGSAAGYSNVLSTTSTGTPELATALVGLMGSGPAPGAGLLVNPGTDGNMLPQMKGGCNA